MRRPRCHAAGRVPFPESQHLFFFLSECFHVNEPIGSHRRYLRNWGLSRNGVKNYSKGPCVTILE